MNMCIATMLWSISPDDQELVFGKLWHIGEWFMQAREWYANAVAETLEKELILFITTNWLPFQVVFLPKRDYKSQAKSRSHIRFDQ